jgi:hypothetical protein
MWTDELGVRQFSAKFWRSQLATKLRLQVGMMKKLLAIAALSLCTLAIAAPSQAQRSRGGSAVRGGAVVRGGGTVRGGGVVVAPRVVGPGYGYRPYYYPRFSFGFGYGYPYYYSPYYYPYGYYGSYGYGYPYGYGGYPYGGGGGYYAEGQAGRGYGGVQIKDAPKDAQVFADGYYAGTVEDFDGAFQHLDLEAGPHRVEIREQGQQPISFEVNVRPGETITYHAR